MRREDMPSTHYFSDDSDEFKSKKTVYNEHYVPPTSYYGDRMAVVTKEQKGVDIFGENQTIRA